MLKRINGLNYNTDTAKELVYYSEYPVASNEYVKEVLYRKRTGEFFLYYKGNANSGYARYNKSAGGYEPSEGIKPLSFKEAKTWYKTYLDQGEAWFNDDQYRELFAPADKFSSDEMVDLHIAISAKAKEVLKQMVAQQGGTPSKVIENLILSNQ